MASSWTPRSCISRPRSACWRTSVFALTEADYIELFLIQGRGAFHLATERGMSAADVERLRSDRNALYGLWLANETRGRWSTSHRVLEALHGRYVMGVVTSSRKDHFDLIHAETGLLKYFDFVLTAADFRRVKPDPEPYLRAVERSGFDGVGVSGHRGLGPRARGSPCGGCSVRGRSDPAHPCLRVSWR